MPKVIPDELDLHGLTVDEAIPLVDGFLEKAFRAHKLRVWVIHGKGTGTLRRAVRQHLTKHPLVRSCATADGNRGGIGATQVDIVD
jgi:DNA mismatch repair protein MutS2